MDVSGGLCLPLAIDWGGGRGAHGGIRWQIYKRVLAAHALFFGTADFFFGAAGAAFAFLGGIEYFNLDALAELWLSSKDGAATEPKVLRTP